LVSQTDAGPSKRDGAEVVGNVEVECVASAAFDLHILGEVAEGLQFQDERPGKLGLQRSHEHQDFEVATLQL